MVKRVLNGGGDAPEKGVRAVLVKRLELGGKENEGERSRNEFPGKGWKVGRLAREEGGTVGRHLLKMKKKILRRLTRRTQVQ